MSGGMKRDAAGVAYTSGISGCDDVEVVTSVNVSNGSA